MAPLRGAAAIGHASPQVSEAHGTWDWVEDEVEIVVVVPVTEQPLVVIVVRGEQVVVETVEPPVVYTVGMHTSVTRTAVSVSVHDDDELEDELDEELLDELSELFDVSVEESDFESLLDLLSSSSLRSSVSDVRSVKVGSMPSTSPPVMLPVILSRSSSTQDKVFMASPMKPKRPLFFFEPHGPPDELPPRSEMRPSTSSLMPLTLLRVSVLSESGFDFQELIIGISATSCEDTEDTADVAWELA